MSVLVCGSLAYDTLLHFDGAFSDHLLPDQLHKLSVCFKVPRLRREFGGCAGNIVYNLRALGGHPCLLASVGEDFALTRRIWTRWGGQPAGAHSSRPVYRAVFHHLRPGR